VYLTQPPQQRFPAAIASLGAVGLIGWALLSGLTVSNVVNAVAPLISVEFANPRPPPPREKAKSLHRAAARQAPSPRNRHNKATPIVAPVLPAIVPPPPIIAAPTPGPGEAMNNGASNRSDPRQGAGGDGNGLGGGGNGNGNEGYGDEPPEQISGDLRFSDLPPELASSGGASMEVRYYVNVNGRASGCRVTTSSGNAAMDAAGCQIVEQRFRFRPSRDGDGQPIRSVMIQKLVWTIDRRDFERGRG
jgi:periplasmic protein TonB